MSKNTTFYAISGHANVGVELAFASGVLAQTLIKAPEEGIIVKSINVSSLDTADRMIELSVLDKAGTKTYVLGTFDIPLYAGNYTILALIPSVNLLDSAVIAGLEKDISGNNIIKLGDGCTLQVRIVDTAITSPLTISVYCSYDELKAVV